MVTAVAANAQYKQIASEGFEDYYYDKALKKEDPCIHPKHFPLEFDEAQIVKKSIPDISAHTGTYYLLVSQNKPVEANIVYNNCDTMANGARIINDSIFNETKVECVNCLGTFTPQPGKYVISAWISRGLNPANTASGNYIEVYANGTQLLGGFTPEGNNIEGWQRISGTFVISTGITSLKVKLLNHERGDIGVDDIRIHPFDASFKSYVYDENTLKFTYELDENNYFTKYEYDESGMLERVKKETERGVMMIQESRFGQQKKL